MIRHHAVCAAGLLLTAGALALVGCAAVADATRYYVLSSTPAAPGDSAPTAVSSAGVGIGPVLVPSYLNRAQIVTRGANDVVEISTYHRWAEPLESGIAQVLADDLAMQIGTERIAVFPWRGRIAHALDHLVVERVGNPAAPRKHRDPLGADLHREVVGQHLRNAALQRLGPAVVRRDLDDVVGAAGDDLRPIEVAGHQHRTDAHAGARDGGGRGVARRRGCRREHIVPGRVRDRRAANQGQCAGGEEQPCGADRVMAYHRPFWAGRRMP